ncbi:MAG: CoA pyrophosphatase [Acidobacteria bacterium]|nr:CoA pyrophosphatase [Acidobacteriota bacterium]
MTVALSALETTLRRRLAMPLPGAAAQRRFAPRPERADWSPDQRPDTARHAAALVLLYARREGVMLPLTVRHHTLPQHAGQVSLPGGAIDRGESPQAAALREADEEIGVAAADVRVLGALSTLWVPVSNFVIHPVVGIADREPAFRLHAREVSALLEVGIAELGDPACVRRIEHTRDGLTIACPAFHVHGHDVWGATAMILAELLSLAGDVQASGTSGPAAISTPRT